MDKNSCYFAKSQDLMQGGYLYRDAILISHNFKQFIFWYLLTKYLINFTFEKQLQEKLCNSPKFPFANN